MSEAPPKAMMRRLPCHVLPLIFVAWFTFCYLVGGDGIFFALMASYPTILVEKLPFVEALSPTYLPVWRQWTDVIVCGYIQWLLVNYLLLKGYCHIKRRSAHR